MTPSNTKLMKAAIGKGFGDFEQNVFLEHQWPAPVLEQDDNKHLIIRVLACALAPGDVRVLSGKTAYVQLPEGLPVIIGSDVSGIVVAAPEACRFRPGDYVVSRFDEPKPQGGLAEYKKVLISLTEKCPNEIDPIQAAGLPATAMAAKRLAIDFISTGHRVLVIGGSGAVGSCVLQYAKSQGASYVAAVSTQVEQCQSYGADRVIDYRTEKWWEIPEFHENKFDVVVDLVSGENWIVGAQTKKAIKSGGAYVALVPGVETEIAVSGFLGIIPFVCSLVGRMLWSRLHPELPTWHPHEALRLEEGDLAALFDDVVKGKLKPVVDPSSPYPFTEKGVRSALTLQKSKHAHGKVVVEISKK